MLEEKLLTIAIPTYNRAETLEKIILQLKKEKNQRFDILVVDDCSPNNKTVRMIRKYQRLMGNLFFYKNSQNLGYSGNVCMLYKLSKTKYIWFLCDDDTVLKGAVDSIYRTIVTYKPTVAVFSCEWINPYGEKKIAGVKEDKVYKSIHDFVDYHPLMRTTYLSILVVKKITSIKTIEETDYKDNIFFQVTLILYLLSQKCMLVESPSKIVKRNVGYKYGEFFKFYLVDQIKAVYAINHNFQNEKFILWAKKQLISSFTLYLSRKIGLFMYSDHPTEETVYAMKIFYGRTYSTILFLYPFLYKIIPSFVLKTTYFLQLILLHGHKNAVRIYGRNINRAITDSRQTTFTSYK